MTANTSIFTRKIFIAFVWLLIANIWLGCSEMSPSENERETKLITPTLKNDNTVADRPLAEVIDLSDEIDLFVVVAGAYSSDEGAKTKAELLKKLGFLNADVIQRPGSKLYSTLVERFDNKEAAERFASELMTNEKIKSYVYQVK